MKKIYWTVWIFPLYYLIQSCQEIIGLKCLQCNSLQDRLCHLGQSQPKECPEDEQKYCITYSGVRRESGSQSTHILFRDCNVGNMTSDCQIVNVSAKGNETKPIRFRMCYRSCDTDGCNRDVHDLSPTGGTIGAFVSEREHVVVVASTLFLATLHSLLSCLDI